MFPRRTDWQHCSIQGTSPELWFVPQQVAVQDWPFDDAEKNGPQQGDRFSSPVAFHRFLRRDILPGLKGGASRGSYVTPVDSDGWESKVRGLSPTGSATKPLLVPVRGFELPDCLTTVGVVGLRFGEANTESTASFPRTSSCTTQWDVNLRRTVKVDDDGRCIPALKREVLAPCTATKTLLLLGHTPVPVGNANSVRPAKPSGRGHVDDQQLRHTRAGTVWNPKVYIKRRSHPTV
jgi:hypothetical protein